MTTHTVTPSEMTFVERPQNKKVISALSLRLSGASLDEICEVVGFASTKDAANAIDKALRDRIQDDDRTKAKMRGLANERLERLLRSAWVKAIDPSHPEQLTAIEKCKGLIDRHIKLYGLDAPTEMVVHNPADSELEQWVMAVIQQGSPELMEADILEGEVIEETSEEGMED